MGNPWLDHVQVTRKANPSKSFKEVLVLAKETYNKSSGDSEKVQKKVQKVRKTRKTQKNAQKTKKKTEKKRKSQKKRKGTRSK